ncbi:hypothetical protein HOO65_060308 [Ceratocystis lukuohia]|uniref:Uncharacterized protein n=1 Tax=Ceratocystis lukuohia TaxID=2019550 RepID=A0ABR4MDY1_9PEZI
MLDKFLKDAAGLSDEDKYRLLFQTLFKRQLSADTYIKFHGPPHGEAYGQAILDTFLQSIADKIEKNPMHQSLSAYEVKQFFLSTIRDVADGLMSPTEIQRQELSRLAMEKAQKGLGPMSLPSFLLQEPFALPVEGELSSTGVALPDSSTINPMLVLEGGQGPIPAYYQAQNLYYGQQGPADPQWSTEAPCLDPITYMAVPPNFIENTAPSSLDIAFDNYVNVNSATNGGVYPTSTGYYSYASFEVGENRGPPLICACCCGYISPVSAEDAALSAAGGGLCSVSCINIMHLIENT